MQELQDVNVTDSVGARHRNHGLHKEPRTAHLKSKRIRAAEARAAHAARTPEEQLSLVGQRCKSSGGNATRERARLLQRIADAKLTEQAEVEKALTKLVTSTTEGTTRLTAKARRTQGM